MDWKSYWNKVALNSNNRFEAVQRNDKNSVSITINHLVSILDISKTDTVLDLCCGNGLLTEKIGDYCNSIIGIDQSDILLEDAKRHTKKTNVTYILGDVMQMADLIKNRKFDKIYLQFSFQYFDKKSKGERIIGEAAKLLYPQGKLFIGDIPDKKKKWQFYNTLPKFFYYISSKIRGKNPMGKFWKEEDLLSICKKLSINGKVVKQDDSLPYSWYRYDFLITKEKK